VITVILNKALILNQNISITETVEVEEEKVGSGEQQIEGERQLMAWPPMSDASGNTRRPRSGGRVISFR